MNTIIAHRINILKCCWKSGNEKCNKVAEFKDEQNKGYCKNHFYKLKRKGYAFEQKPLNNFPNVNSSWMTHTGKNIAVGDKKLVLDLEEDFSFDFLDAERLFVEEEKKKKKNFGIISTQFGDRYLTLEVKLSENFIAWFSKAGYCTALVKENGKIIRRK